jgi:hypothetical protein
VPIRSVRRYYLRKSQALDLLWEPSLAGAYRAKQDGVPGTPLPADFPLRLQLSFRRYTTKEDLAGADVAELMNFARLNRRDAQTVLDAVAALP